MLHKAATVEKYRADEFQGYVRYVFTRRKNGKAALFASITGIHHCPYPEITRLLMDTQNLRAARDLDLRFQLLLPDCLHNWSVSEIAKRGPVVHRRQSFPDGLPAGLTGVDRECFRR